MKVNEIRVVAVSGSMDVLHEKTIDKVTEALRSIGWKVSFSAHATDERSYGMADIRKRTDDLHTAFMDPQVAAILIGVGGTRAIELLPWLDFELIRTHPKPVCGFSDATVLLNAIYAVTGMITYYGPLFFSFAVNADLDFTIDYWQKALFSKEPFALTPALRWGNYMDMYRNFVNEGYQVIREGHADGILVGGHLPSLNLLQGTRYLPELEGAVLFVEICDRYGKDAVSKLNQYLDALLLQKGADGLKGLLVGRLLKEEAVSSDELTASLLARENLKHIPIIINVDFGHTTPMVTLPIGGRISIDKDQLRVEQAQAEPNTGV